jgi:hypothetical protein
MEKNKNKKVLVKKKIKRKPRKSTIGHAWGVLRRHFNLCPTEI